MTPEYFYTVDLKEHYGPKLERLAALASEEPEEYAAMLLAHAIDLEEAEWKAREEGAAESTAEAIKRAGGLFKIGSRPKEIDDDLPF